MQITQKRARIAGIMFILAIAASLSGGFLIQSILDKPQYMEAVLANAPLLSAGIALELVNAIAVLIIVIMLWPSLKEAAPAAAAALIGLRITESIFCIFAAAIPVVILTLAGRGVDSNTVLLADMLVIVRSGVVSYMIPLFFGIGALVFYRVLFRTRLVPPVISLWGIAAAAAILANMFVSSVALTPFFALPIIANELCLGVYLIAKKR